MPATEGVEALRIFQGSTLETTYGTAQTTATWIHHGVPLGTWMTDDRTAKKIPEKLGYFGGTNRRKIAAAKGMFDLPATPLDIWAQPIYLRYLGIGPATYTLDPGAGTLGTGWVYKAGLPTGARPTINSFTAQMGNDYEAWQMTGAFFNEITYSGKEEDVIMFASKGLGRAPELLGNQGTAFTPNLGSPPTQTYNATIQMPDTPTMGALKLFIDPIGAANYGLTQVSDTLIDFDLSYKITARELVLNNTTPVVTAAGQPGVTRYVLTSLAITGKCTFLYNSVSTYGSGGQGALARADTTQRLRFQAFGTPLSVAGTGAAPNTYANQLINWDCPVYYAKMPTVGSRNGIDVLQCEFVQYIDPYKMTTPDNGFITVVVNGNHTTAPVLP